MRELAKRQGKQKWAFKPSACILYPLFEEDGVIAPDTTLDDELWCSKKENHATTVFRACLVELEYLAGKEAVEKLKALEKDYLKATEPVGANGKLRMF